MFENVFIQKCLFPNMRMIILQKNHGLNSNFWWAGIKVRKSNMETILHHFSCIQFIFSKKFNNMLLSVKKFIFKMR